MYPGLPSTIFAAEPGRAAAPHNDGAESPFPDAALATPVLIVEDEMLIAWQVQDLLLDMGFTDVRTAGSFADAVKAAEDTRPGLLVCDVNLGDGPDGIAAAGEIRAAGPIPTVFVTGYAGEEIARRIAEGLPDAHMLRKPVEARRLKGSLRELLGRTQH